VSLFTFGDVKLLVTQGSEFILYATYVVGEYDFLNISSQVLDAGYRGLGKAVKKAKSVIAVEPVPFSICSSVTLS